MTNRAVTSAIVHTSLEELGYRTCWRHGTKLYRWLGGTECPRCEADGNPNLIRRNYVPVQEAPPPTPKAIRDSRSRQKGGDARRQINKRKLNDEQVMAMRERYRGGESLGSIGRVFKVDTTTAGKAVRGKGCYAEAPGEIPTESAHVSARDEKKKKVTSSRQEPECVKLDALADFLDICELTRKELAEQAGFPFSTLKAWANGKNRKGCPVEKAQELAKFFSRELGRTVTVEELQG